MGTVRSGSTLVESKLLGGRAFIRRSRGRRSGLDGELSQLASLPLSQLSDLSCRKKQMVHHLREPAVCSEEEPALALTLFWLEPLWIW